METTLASVADFSASMEAHMAESADDIRRVIAGISDKSVAAEIYAKYAHLYDATQIEFLSAHRKEATTEDEAERAKRLWFEAVGSAAERDTIAASEQLINDKREWKTEFHGGERSINDLLAISSAEPDFQVREEAYALICEADELFAPREIALAAESQEIRSTLFEMPGGEVEIAQERMGIDLHEFATLVQKVSDSVSTSFEQQAQEMHPRLLGHPETRPSRGHAAYIRAMHSWDSTYTSEKMLEVCERTLTELGFPLTANDTIHVDVEERPGKDPRACVIPVTVPSDVHLLVRPTGSLTDYAAYLHEAGHALHFGLTSASLPFEYRTISPDNALTEIYSYVLERITHEPTWHQRHFGLSDTEAAKVVSELKFVEASLFRRYAAKLQYELEFWGNPSSPNNPELYQRLLSRATHMTYPTSQFASDIDPGLYVADYLRAWRTSAQVIAWLRREHGSEWFMNRQTAVFLRDLFEQGTRPTNEDVSRMIGSSPDNFDDFTAYLTT